MQVEVQGIPVHVSMQGAGRPVLLIHGWQGSHLYMAADLEPCFAASPHEWRRVYIDLPGHGQTPAPEWLRSQAQMVSILHDVVEAVFDDEPFAVMGNSYGGYLTLSLVRAMGHRLTGAALLVPDLPAPDGSRDTPDRVTLVHAPGAFDDLADDEAWMPDALVEQSRRAVEEMRAHDMPSIRVADQEFLERLNGDYLLPESLRAAGEPFDRPSLIIAGHQDATVGYRPAMALVDEFPRATVAVLDVAGHWLGRVERPELFNALVVDWLERMVIAGGDR